MAEAECELSGNLTRSSVRATAADTVNDLLVAEGFHGPLAHLTPNGEVNESFPIINLLTVGALVPPLIGGPFTEQLTVNEQQTFSDGGFSQIRATGLHMIMTNAQGTVVLDLRLDVVYAAIHCEKHLPNDDAIGA